MNNLTELLNLMNEYDISYLEYQNDNISAKLRKANKNNLANSAVPSSQKHLISKNVEKTDEKKFQKVLSSIVGIFHLAEGIKEGTRVNKGDVLGRIESMKMFTDIPSPSDGVVERIKVDDECPVEFEQELIEIVR